MEQNSSPETNLRYANALSRWGEVGGYDAEVLWEQCTTAAFGRSIGEVGHRPVATLSGGEQKRLALEAFFRSDADVLLLDEPDNLLDIPGKRWLEEKMTHDRWFMRLMDRFLVFHPDGSVTEEIESPYGVMVDG